MKINFKYNDKDANGDACVFNDLPPLLDCKTFKSINKTMVQGNMHMKKGDTVTWPNGTKFTAFEDGYYSLIFEVEK